MLVLQMHLRVYPVPHRQNVTGLLGSATLLLLLLLLRLLVLTAAATSPHPQVMRTMVRAAAVSMLHWSPATWVVWLSS
jgi:hypothetical protein